MCVFKYHAFIFCMRPPRWRSETVLCLYSFSCPVLPVPIWMSRSGCPVLAVLSWLLSPSCIIKSVYLYTFTVYIHTVNTVKTETSKQKINTVPDRRCRIQLEIVLVRRWVIGVLGIWRGEGLGKGLGQGRSVYKQAETEVDGSCHS